MNNPKMEDKVASCICDGCNEYPACVGCGFDRKVAAERMKLIEVKGLTVRKDGKRFLKLPKTKKKVER